MNTKATVDTVNLKVAAEKRASRLWERMEDAAKDNAQQMRDIAIDSLVALDKAELLVIKLKAALEAAEKRIAELEWSESQLIEERDNAEEALADMYQAATGERPEWSNWFGYADAVDAVTDRVAELEAGINLRRGESNHG